ncbi:SAC3/GANP/Nin1/mts3/eIF-3 p25 family protein [Candida parapsilosis]|uniref:Nuclear mRNA export factor n=2 Tax=Candida parapsilosis TaxID=5480 RepID=G8BDU3_CANPC|nr:uncharacterized protein CPAR2_210840 [Candida parapsilosis]KAF6054411.1 SAC3/GANP/Nin1/mts3/eIF-3 p25 family protein [Candida parapsilosis]KAF6056565.1 SAC3/GANP/Nin1/mts3/eIF-3 p25 family protein [Candida parapsilosis]KAF6059500.1 SAC3/GANP/Nin1/mts3/eIF-3 p25 family protein [Candida parapsilosis]KAF6068253.1 SAC3/GANP/Nin1/mts3/eIF-3 p25 family protein [Candida parapsilosis]KAI5904979.1 Nuclear mRNA export protein SAC3 [Candida parapsilosis]
MSFTFEGGTPISFTKGNTHTNSSTQARSASPNGNAINGSIALEGIVNRQVPFGVPNDESFRAKRKAKKPINSRSNEPNNTNPFSKIGNGTSPQKNPNQTSGQAQSFSADEISVTGPLFPDPQALGFQPLKKNVTPRPIPKYFLTQPKCLDTPPFVQNEWDRQNQIKMEQMESANQGKDYQGLYEDLQKLREIERKEMEELGLVDAENTAKHLNEAIAFQGSCLDMCPVFERVRRQLENNVNVLERDPSTNKITKEKAVKAFSRPAAGQPPPLPSEVRPPHVLQTTLNYLIENVVDKLPESHSFLWDRTRSIRQDFTYQNSFGPEAVDCNERIVRIHLLSLHIMAGSDVEFSQQQELEQFNKALQTLMEIYQDVRNNGGSSPNEAEFRAYHLLSHIRDPELERQIQNSPDYIYQDSRVQLALNLRKIISQNNIVERGVTNLIGALDLYVEFFRVVYSEETPLLMACLLETHFSEIRFYALKAMSRSFHTRGKPYQLDTLRNLLGFDSSEQSMKFLKYYEIDVIIENGETLVDLFNKDKLEKSYKLNSFYEKPKYPPVYSSQLDRKLKGKNLISIINSGSPNVSFHLKSKKDILTSSKRSTSGSIATSFKASTTTFPAITPVAGAFKPNDIKFVPPQVSRPSKPLTENATFSQPQTTPTTSAPSNSATAQSPFLFGVANEVSNVRKTRKPETGDTVESVKNDKPKIDFSFNKPFTLQGTSPTRMESKSNPAIKPSPVPSFGEQTSQVMSAKSFAPQKETPETSNQLVNHPLFQRAADQIAHELISNMVDSEFRAILENVLHRHNTKVQRLKIIMTLEEELFSAFVAESAYQCTLETASQYMSNLLAQKHAIRRLAYRAKKCILSYKDREAKRRELQSVTFGSSLKREFGSGTTTPTSSRKKHHTNANTMDFVKKQEEMGQLWKTLDLKQFTELCSSEISLKLSEENLKLKWLLVVEDWENEYSRWLIAKFGLKPNMVKMVYENNVRSDKVDLEITSLPSKDGITKSFLRDCGFILFECGLCFATEEGIRDKLIKDAKVLKQIISVCEKYSFYKPSVLILFWDVTQSGLSSGEAVKLLNLQQYTFTNSLKNLIFCDMANEHESINRVLTSSVTKIGMDFDGELSSKGVKHYIKVKQSRMMKQGDELVKKRQTSPTTNGSITEKDKSLMLNAKKLERYNYLNSFKSLHSTSKLADTHVSVGDVANKSLAKIIARRGSRHNLSLVSSNSTFLNTSIMTNNSILEGFGKGVVQESTPNTSFKRKVVNETKDSIDAGDDKLSKLRKLTANIRNKYRKSQDT